MMWIGLALCLWGILAFLFLRELLQLKRDVAFPKLSTTTTEGISLEPLKDLQEDVNRIKLMLNIRTFKAQGDKK